MISAEQVARVAAVGGGSIPLPQGFVLPLSLAEGRAAPVSWAGIYAYSNQIPIEPNQRLTAYEWRGYGPAIGFVDRMVREDPILQGLRLALTLPLLSGTWTVEPPPDPSPQETEATDLARSLLLEQTAGGSWHEHLEHLLSYAWRGWAAAEMFWPFDRESGRTRLGLSPILPWTVWRWEPLDGNRWAMHQIGRQGEIPPGTPDEQRRGVVLQPEDFVQVRWQPEADNPEPYGPLRSCWADWMARTDYRRLEAQGFLRAAYGVPSVTVDPSAQGFDPSSATVDAVNSALQEYRAGLRAANVFPPGYRLQIQDFPFKADQIREAIVQLGHSMMTAIHATFLRTGETRGALSLHDGQVQFFSLTLGAVGERLAAAFNGPDGLLKRLVARNLPGVRRFPWLQPPRVQIGSPADLVRSVVEAETAGHIVDAGRLVEDHLRALLGLPARPEPTVSVPGAPSIPAAPASERTEEIADEEAAMGGAGSPTAIQLADCPASGPGGRALLPAETVVSLAETRARTEGARDRMAAIIAEWRADIAAEYGAAVADAPDLPAARVVPVPRREELVTALGAELRRVYRAGGESVQAERERMAASPRLRRLAREGQLEVGSGGDLPSPKRAADCRHGHRRGLSLAERVAAFAGVRLAAPKPVRAPAPKSGQPESEIDAIDPEGAIAAVLSTTVDDVISRIQSATAAALQAQGTGGQLPTDVDVQDLTRETVAGLSSRGDAVLMQGDVNTIFGLGRQQEHRAEGASRYLYSALLESQSCEPCLEHDGQTFGADELDEWATPADWCEGGSRCNCLLLAPPETE